MSKEFEEHKKECGCCEMKEPKLKTLKDLDVELMDEGYANEPDEEEYINKKELKAEAIKWIKEDKELCLSYMSSAGVIDTLMRRWKDRFNLSEEDLK